MHERLHLSTQQSTSLVCPVLVAPIPMSMSVPPLALSSPSFSAMSASHPLPLLCLLLIFFPLCVIDAALTMEITSVSCSSSSSSSLCDPNGSSLIINGLDLTCGSANALTLSIGAYSTTALGNPSGSFLTAQAPSISPSDWYSQLQVQVTCAQDGTSAQWSGLMFGSPPTVTAVSGCGSDSTATGCRAGDTVNITGTNFVRADLLTVDVGSNACDCPTVSDSLIVCTLPAVAAAEQNVSLPLTVSITATDSTSASLDAAVTYAPALAITSVSGCGFVGDIRFCYGGEVLTLTGDWFGSDATVSAGNGSCGAVTVHSSSRLTCTLPANLPVDTAIHLLVSSGGMLSNIDASLFVLPPVELHSVSPCASRTLPGCLFGDNITLDGLFLTNPLTVTVGTTQVEGAWTRGGDSVVISLPEVSESSQGVWLDVRVQCGVSGANWTGAVLYRQYPQPSAVRASCRNGSSQCVSGDRIEVAGRHLNASSSLVAVLLASPSSSSSHSCLSVTTSASSISCLLPPIPAEEQATELTLSVVVDGAESAGVSGAVSYAALPAVSAISGCDQNGAANCHPGQMVTVDGWHLAQQDTSVTLSPFSFTSSSSSYPCTMLPSTTDSLRCQLPAHVNATDRGVPLSLFVTANGWTSAPASNLSFTVDDLSLVSLAGCDQPTAHTAVSGCRAGSQLTLTGTAFTSPALLVLSSIAGNHTTAVTVRSLTVATVQLPDLSSTSPSLVFSATLLCGVASNTLPAALSYSVQSSSSSSSSSSSTGAEGAGGGSGLYGLSGNAAVVLGAALICAVLAILACVWNRGASYEWRAEEMEGERAQEPSDVERGRQHRPADHRPEPRAERAQRGHSREQRRQQRERRADLRAPLVF